uniref:MADF domain-containing protein n=1 Tax=Paramormyrops kingsleyae TaxID=1676925 RepID=A0A3B3RL34_9TELE
CRMEEKLIIAVAGFPLIYDVSLFAYRDINKKKRCMDQGVRDSYECKKRWKSLRDTYRKERRKEAERKRSGAGASSVRPWRYSGVMGFLNPFLEDRIPASNMEGGVGEALIQEESEDAIAGHSQAAQTAQTTHTHSQQCEANQLCESPSQFSLLVQEGPSSPRQSSVHVQANVQGQTGHSNKRKRAHSSTEF